MNPEELGLTGLLPPLYIAIRLRGHSDHRNLVCTYQNRFRKELSEVFLGSVQKQLQPSLQDTSVDKTNLFREDAELHERGTGFLSQIVPPVMRA